MISEQHEFGVSPLAPQVADIFCARCHAAVGWQYLCCYEASQQYKEGHVILEKAKLHRSWKDSAAPSPGGGGGAGPQ
jgi:hypothetical protein